MDEIDRRRRYTCNISQASDSMLPEYSMDDGFILNFIVNTRYENIYFRTEGNRWVLYSITEGPNPKKSSFLVPRTPLVSGNIDQTLEAANLSIVLEVLGIPVAEHPTIVSEIKEFAWDMAFCNDPPALLPILIEIGKWSGVNVTDHIIVGAEREDDYEEDDEHMFEQISEMSIESHQPRGRPAAAGAVNELVESGGIVVPNAVLKCVICLEKLSVGSNVFRMPCGHMFHPDCILQWLAYKNECPICRFNLPVELVIES